MEVGQIRVDFTVDSAGLNPQLIRVIDNSEWFSAEDKQSTIYITMPGSSRPITHIFAKHKINTYNSTNLGLDCIVACEDTQQNDLSDGIYKITLKSAYEGLEKTRYYLKTDQFLISWYKEFASAGLDYVDTNNSIYDALYDSRKHLTTAEAFMLDGDFTKANREFTDAQKKFDALKKCKNCY